MPVIEQDSRCTQHAGTPRTCFACGHGVGEQHSPHCAAVVRRVQVVEGGKLVERDVPWGWTIDTIEFLVGFDKEFLEFVRTIDDEPREKVFTQ